MRCLGVKEAIRSKVQGKEHRRVKAQKVQKGRKETKGVKAKGRAKVERAKERQRIKEKEKGKAPTALKKQAPQTPIKKTGMKEETRVRSPWEQGEWGDDQGWEEWQEDGDWKEGNGLLIGGLEKEEEKGKEEEREKRNKDKKKKEEKKVESSAAVLGPGGSGSPVVRMSGFGDRLRDAGLDPELLQGLNDDEAQELQDALLESLAALQARRAKARSAEPISSRQRRRQRPKREKKESQRRSRGGWSQSRKKR